MAKGGESISDIAGCLRDCGCSDEQIRQYLAYETEHHKTRQIRLLMRHRRSLMQNLHQTQREIDCIDFIIRKLEE